MTPIHMTALMLVAGLALSGCSDSSDADEARAAQSQTTEIAQATTPARRAVGPSSPEIDALKAERDQASGALIEIRKTVATLEADRETKAAALAAAIAADETEKVTALNAELAMMDLMLADQKALNVTMFRAFKELIARHQAAVDAAS